MTGEVQAIPRPELIWLENTGNKSQSAPHEEKIVSKIQTKKKVPLAGRRNEPSDRKSHDDVSMYPSPFVAMSSYPSTPTQVLGTPASFSTHSSSYWPRINSGLAHYNWIAPTYYVVIGFCAQALIAFPPPSCCFQRAIEWEEERWRLKEGRERKCLCVCLGRAKGTVAAKEGEEERDWERQEEERTLDVHRGRTDIFGECGAGTTGVRDFQ